MAMGKSEPNSDTGRISSEEGEPPSKRIGLFGGTFNPIHFGHLQAAQVVVERLNLTSVLFIPAAIPPHKIAERVASTADRLEMIRFAIAEKQMFSVSEVELQRAGPSYTIDTVSHFRNSDSSGSQYFLIIGLDAFLEIDTWKSFKALMNQIPLVVLARPETSSNFNTPIQRTILAFLHSKISIDYQLVESTDQFIRPNGQPLFLIQGGFRELSATSIRERIRLGEDIQTLVPIPVRTFIQKKGLYR
jgi:nicotinate-nucleotide adenylyltransferase